MRITRRLAPVLFVPLALFGAASCSTESTTATGPTVAESAVPGASGSVTDPSTSDIDPSATGAATPEAPRPNTTLAARVTAKNAKIHATPDDAAKVLTEVGQTTKLGSKTTMLATEV